MAEESGAPADTAPSVAGRYQIMTRLASDAIDEVYRGFDPLIQRPVIVKLFHLDGLDAATAARITELFYTVMRRTGGLADPGLMTIYDVGEMPGALFVASEFVEGRSLTDSLAQDRGLDLERQVSILSQIADALEAARAQGVFHLNLKPSSVILGVDHSVKVGGLGVAAVTDALVQATGVPRRGRARYDAPERAAGQAGDARTDVFSLAEIAIDVLASGTAREGHVGAIPPLPPDLGRRGVQVDRWAMLFARALALEPAGRFESTAAFKAELLAVLGVDELQARLAWDALGPSSLKSVAVDSEAETFLSPAEEAALTGLKASAPQQPRQESTTHDDEDDVPPTAARPR